MIKTKVRFDVPTEEGTDILDTLSWYEIEALQINVEILASQPIEREKENIIYSYKRPVKTSNIITFKKG